MYIHFTLVVLEQFSEHDSTESSGQISQSRHTYYTSRIGISFFFFFRDVITERERP